MNPAEARRATVENSAKAREALEGPGPFLITFHARPDGDALGSALGLRLWLESRGCRAEVVSSHGVPDPFGFLPSADRVLTSHPVDLTDYTAVVLDTPDATRAAISRDALDGARITVNIDHHPGNGQFGDVNVVDTSASSAALMVYELLPNGPAMTPDIASALYVGVMTDTGGFRFGNTDARTLRAAADLVNTGAEPARLANLVYGEQPLGRLRLLGAVLSSTETALDGRVAISVLTESMKAGTGSTGEDIEGLAGYGRLVSGVEVALLLREEDDKVRVSLRSKGSVDVNAVARRLGGGGHRSAAGVLLDGPLESARELLLAAVAETIVQRDAGGDV
jgi:phosphoesterase RecJ-like protein